ncbi:MAG: hypothetical protein R3Y22_09255 [Bacteroidales bacterium]
MVSKKGKKILGLIAVMMVGVVASCDFVDSQRIPAVAVNVELDTYGMWSTYGVHSYGAYRVFNKSTGTPSNFSYTTGTYTGYGGLLLISGYDFMTGDYNSPLVYDMACPVEVSKSTLITIDSETKQAVCNTCGSRYDVCEGQGAPVSGKAYELKYGLQKYTATASAQGGYLLSR